MLRCQVPEEFNKGMEVGAAELEAKKASAPAAVVADASEAKKPEEDKKEDKKEEKA